MGEIQCSRSTERAIALITLKGVVKSISLDINNHVPDAHICGGIVHTVASSPVLSPSCLPVVGPGRYDQVQPYQ